MKVTGLDILRCDAGWRNSHFLRLTTDDGIVGWREFDEGFGISGGQRGNRAARRAGHRTESIRPRADLYRALLLHPASGGRRGRRRTRCHRKCSSQYQGQGTRGALPYPARRQGARSPGWGTEPNEEAIRAHPPKAPGGLLHYGPYTARYAGRHLPSRVLKVPRERRQQRRPAPISIGPRRRLRRTAAVSPRKSWRSGNA